ncbi:MAG: hypothetical protein ACJAR8_000876 [Bacteroidia bacterium]|jgi:hypothetical protein
MIICIHLKITVLQNKQLVQYPYIQVDVLFSNNKNFRDNLFLTIYR